MLWTDKFFLDGVVAEKYGCAAAASPATLVPDVRWAGISGAGRTFAVTLVDLDSPHGLGSMDNKVQPLFWAANIPSDWTELNEAKLVSNDASHLVLGRNFQGGLGLVPVCPRQGKHRLRLTLWALSGALDGVGPDMTYPEVIEHFESAELARYDVFQEVSPAPAVPPAALGPGSAPAPAPAAASSSLLSLSRAPSRGSRSPSS